MSENTHSTQKGLHQESIFEQLAFLCDPGRRLRRQFPTQLAQAPLDLSPSEKPSGTNSSMRGVNPAPPDSLEICTAILSPGFAAMVQVSVSPAVEMALCSPNRS